MGSAHYDHFETIELPNKPLREISALDITGRARTLSEFIDKNKAILIVNVASQSKNAQDEYHHLINAYGKYRKKGLEILAFPCDQFEDENFPDSEIRSFNKTIGAKFPIFAKTDVNGIDMHHIYRWLKMNSPRFNDKIGDLFSIPGNFAKFLINSDGEIVDYYDPNVEFETIEEDIIRLIS